ncbi:hypothetical protein VTK73DRAFT_10149 [Phialemonium thermophilum]|uniref:Zn(2)-C6 fungal-type domain-containing protein n=1 Tax=Phialemonium thermophilum TaxID=223376 RepID=A0ABR3XH80_9PEZI
MSAGPDRTAAPPESTHAGGNFDPSNQTPPNAAGTASPVRGDVPFPQIPQNFSHPSGATVYPPSAAVSSALNPRSCVTCRRRKVRCDKHMPCGNCRRAQIACIFPAPGRAPRRPRPKDPDAPSKQHSAEREAELLKRLRKLEGIVEELSSQVELEAVKHTSSSGNSPEEAISHDGEGRIPRSGRAESSAASDSPQPSNSPALTSASRAGTAAGRLVSGSGYNTSYGPLKAPSSGSHRRLGRLVQNEKGTSRYVSSGFWSKLNDELEEIRAETQDYTDEDTDDSDVESTSGSLDQEQCATAHQSFILGYKSADVDLRPLHPLPSQIPFMWQVYLENVDPLVKILHTPSMNKLIREIRNNLDNLNPSTEALMFSIYYAAITSMDAEEVKLNFGAERHALLKQYRFALEQALAKANFLTDADLTVCQAFLIFLVLVRRHDETRFAWTMTGLLIRICQSIGLHRDGTNFPNLTPFEVEMRRRLFWAVCVLDLRSAEDQGTDLTLVERTYDTQVPLNINDTDIDPSSKEFPAPREGPTDMTFSLIRYEICGLSRRLHVASSAMAGFCPQEAARSLWEREEMLTEAYERIENKYLKYPSVQDNPLYWVVSNVARLIVAKMTILIYQPVLFPGPGSEYMSSDSRERVFTAAIDICEYSHLLVTDPRTKPWRWLFKTYTQWHAVAYILLELSHRPWNSVAERAWSALLHSAYISPDPHVLEKMAKYSAVWLPFRKLYHKARKHRETELARLQADPAAAEQLDRETRSRLAPSNFKTLSSSIKTTVALDRWRKLVNLPPLPPQQQDKALKLQIGSSSVSSRDDSSGTTTAAPHEDHIIDEIMGETMTSPFIPMTLFPMAWTAGDPSYMARQAMFSGTAAPYTANANANEIPISNAPVQGGTMLADETVGAPAGGVNVHDPSTKSPRTLHDQRQQHRHDALHLKESNPPPWLWNADTGSGNLVETSLDDLDMNMDEGFDWQNWQQSIRGFEMETNTAGFGGVWGSSL